MEITDAWIYSKIIMLSIVAIAGLVSGIKIYQNMLKGGDIEGPAIRWIAGLTIASMLIYAVETLVYNDGGLTASPVHFTVISYAAEAHQAAIYIGVVLAIIGLISIYKKYQEGDEDLSEHMLKWFGALMFLFSMGWIIDNILN